MYVLTLFNITYTIVAYLSIAVGIIELIFDKNNNKKFVSYLLIINGCLLRKEAVFPVLISIGVVYFIKLIKQKNKKNQIFGISILVTILIINKFGTLFYSQNQTLELFYEWQQASINLRDYKPLVYNDYKEVFLESGWNENDTKLFYSWGFADKEKYSVQSMKKIASSIQIKDKYNINVISILNEFFKQYINSTDWNQFYIIVFIALFIISLIKNEDKKTTKYVFISTILVNLLLIIRQRNLYRVVYPQYLIACLYYIYLLADNKKQILKGKWKKITGVINIVLCLVFIISYTNNYRNANKELIYNSKIIEELSDDGNLYIVESGIYNKLTMYYNITESRKIGEYKNIIKAGGGDCFSQRYYNYVEKFDLKYPDNLYKNLVQDNIYYIGDINEVIISYMKENIDANKEFVLYKTIEGINIYKYI